MRRSSRPGRARPVHDGRYKFARYFAPAQHHIPRRWRDLVAYNDLGQLTRVLEEHGSEIAAFVVEPVIENLSIVVPDAGYLAAVRELCDEHGVVLIFDEVKTGLTAGAAGAAQRLGVKPDLITLAGCLLHEGA